ncbi:MAG: TrkH family potassium uptake protein [Prolixibacteraceae bacterium]|nr:TrkH family potassium uptake protein [Prolixibacteraceae bacterium]
MLSIITLFLFFCAGLAYYYQEQAMPFILSLVITFAFSVCFFLVSRRKKEEQSMNKKDAYFTVTISWVIIALIGSLPYLFSQSIPSFTNAFFESMSGFTTTGASILTDIESLPKSILFWRSLTHWIGGIGIIVLVIIVMPSLQIGGYQLFTMESSLHDKIKPKIKAVGNRLLLIYLLLTFVEIVLLLFGGMNLFESVCHAFGTVATGGFSPKNDSIASYSPYIQYVITLFMLLAGMNFVVHYYLLKRDFKKIKQNDELKFYLFVVALVGLLITATLFFKMHKPLELSFREAFFQVISIITCTGFATTDYLQWPVFGWALIFAAMFLGGSTGSTAGGIKMARHLVLVKNIKNTFRQLMSRHAVIPLRLNQHTISTEENNTILSFIFIYNIVFLIGSFSLLFLGIDGKTAASSVATCMAGIGPGIGTVGPVSNFAHLPDIANNILSILMLLGRLEIYTVIVLFTPRFWKP